MKTWQSKVMLLAMVAFLLAFLGCGEEKKEEAVKAEKEKYFTIYFCADLSRAIGFVNAPRAIAMSDTIDFINQKFGGVADSRGEMRKLRLEWYDDQFDYSLSLPNIERWGKRKNFIFLAACILPAVVRERCAELEVVMKNCGISEPLLYPAGWVFGSQGLRANQVATFIKWVCDNWDYEKMGRKPRIVLSSYDTASGRYAIRPFVQEYIKKNFNCDIVDVAFSPLICVDPGTWLARFKAKKADWIIGHHIGPAIGPMIKESHAGGYGFKFGLTDSALEGQTINKLAGGPEACNGKFFGCGVLLFLDWVAKQKPDSLAGELYRFIKKRRGETVDQQQIGYCIGPMDVIWIYEALKDVFAANKDITWENLHSRHIAKYVNDNWSNRELWGMGTMNYGPTRRDPKYTQILSVENGRPVFDGKWRELIRVIEPEFIATPFKMPTTEPLPKKAS